MTLAHNDAAAKKLVLHDGMIQQADERFYDLGLTQQQADGIMQVHLHHVAWIFTPGTWSPLQRIGLAWHFLFGKGPL